MDEIWKWWRGSSSQRRGSVSLLTAAEVLGTWEYLTCSSGATYDPDEHDIPPVI